MTKDLHLGLGSGALREALTTIRDHLVMVDENWYPNNEELRGRIQNMIALADGALSLSSPTEPPPNDVPCPENERSATTAEESGIRSAGNLAQASSEIGEALAAEQLLNEFVGYISVEYQWEQERWENCQKLAKLFLAALAPSRQGAGGK